MQTFSYTHIIDISLPINEQTVVYPGNPSVEIESIKSASGGSTVSKITIGSHTATHVDAQSHVMEKGKNLESIPLDSFIGPCRVIDATKDEISVSLETVQALDVQPGERVLLKTQNSLRSREVFDNNYIFLSSPAAEYLAERVILVGIDYLSIKQKGSKDTTPHDAFLHKNIPIVEGLDLSKVEEGKYFMAILPMKLDIDGGPVRAVLLK